MKEGIRITEEEADLLQNEGVATFLIVHVNVLTKVILIVKIVRVIMDLVDFLRLSQELD